MHELWREYRRTRSIELRNQLVEVNLNLAKYHANAIHRRSQGTEYENLFGYACLGLIDAVEKFDPDRGVKFSTYSTRRIRGAILCGMRDEDWVPRMARKRGGIPAVTSIEQLRCEESSLLDLLHYHDRQTDDTLDCMMRGLGTRQKTVVKLHYIDGITMKSVGKLIGVGEARVSQIAAQAMRIMQEKGLIMREQSIQNEILRTFGTRPDMRLWRSNCGVARMGDRTVRFGVPGQADLHGILPGGLFLAIEVKSETGQQTPEQRAYQAMIDKFGGVYVLARSVADVWSRIGEYLNRGAK